jgi:AbiV family abortive infection protein
MEIPKAIKQAEKACLSNAERLLAAARACRKPGSNYIAYHLAALALEEIGKATMVTVSNFHLPSLPKPSTDEDRRRPIDWIEDHERKLFWALWTPLFGRQADMVKQIQTFQSIAKRIHEIRLATLYVNPENLSAQQDVPDEELDTVIGLTEARLGMEQVAGMAHLDEPKRQLIEWFFISLDNQQLRPFLLNAATLAKLAEFEADPFKWVEWLRTSVTEMENTNRELGVCLNICLCSADFA